MPAFVGRATELAALRRALAATRAGRGAGVLVVGDAGIGKTRLASELAAAARTDGFDVLLGRSIDLVGTELPYQPVVEALPELGELRQAGSQLRVFETALTLLTQRAETAPVLLVVEDLHWADVSTLDLVVFLAHNLHDRRVLLLATFRADELGSADRMRRLTDGVRRSAAAVVLELGPLAHAELTTLLAAHDDAPPASLADTIAARAEGNPFFAEELLVAADEGDELPRGLRDLLLQRVTRLDPPAQSVLRAAAAAGREVSYPLLCATASLAEPDVREALRRGVEHGVLVPDLRTGSFRFRHALLAEAIYATILPGEREELHARLAGALARSGAATPAELAPHWAAAGRRDEALAASVVAARQAEAVFGLAEALAHLERALVLWPSVPDAAELAGVDLAELSARAAELAGQTGAAPRAVELIQRAIELVGDGDPSRAALLHESLGRHLFASGRADAALAAFERAVELVPPRPPSPERAHALASLANGLMLAWRHDESLAVCEQVLPLARAVGARGAELRALTVLGSDLAYLGHADEGIAQLRLVVRLAEACGDRVSLQRAYVDLTDVLTMVGRPRESARLAHAALPGFRRYGLDHGSLVANRIEALVASGAWDEAERASEAALRAITANFPHHALITRAELEAGRGDFAAARAHYETARTTLHLDRDVAIYDAFVSELALAERRWADADAAVRDGLARAPSPQMAQIRVWLCAKGLRAQAELAAVARARRDPGAVGDRLGNARTLLIAARRAAAESAAVTPNAAGWLAMAEAEHQRARGAARADLWSDAAAAWERLERPPLTAYCRWREAEAFVAAGAPRGVATASLWAARAIAARIGAKPLLRELELLAERARLESAPPAAGAQPAKHELEELLGLTPRESEVLTLVARGLTNREIAAELVISVKTAAVHVTHILRKLDAPNRREAAAIAHRLAPPASTL
jgi:DNA-binding CsgD family transcriptional regulator/tetratricopeptide (TPR) repeat protein